MTLTNTLKRNARKIKIRIPVIRRPQQAAGLLGFCYCCTNYTQPTGALDYNTGKSILKLLQDTCRTKGVTVIVITHNLALTKMGDKVIHVKNGKVSSIEVNENPLPIEEIEW